MPFLPQADPADGEIYYRTWEADRAWAQVLLLHGIGENSGLYHRFAFQLAAAGIRVSAIDQPGHGFSSGARGQPARIEVLASTARRAIEHLADDLPLFVVAHSMGTSGAALLALENSLGLQGLVLSACLLAPWQEEEGEAFSLDALSSDPFYLDQIVHNPFPLPEPDLEEFWSSELPALWSRIDHPFDVPTLVLHGELDPIVPVNVARRVAAVTNSALNVYPGNRHDVLNDVSHRLVAADIVAFIRSLVASH